MTNRRNTELLLLIGAAPLVLILYGMYLINTGTTLSVSTLIVPLGLICAFTLAHVAVRFLAPQSDPAVLPIVFILSGIGITFVTRLAPTLALRQVVWLFLSIGAMIAVLLVVRKLDFLIRFKYTAGIIGIVLLLLPALIGFDSHGSRLWVGIKGVFGFQPGELAKIFIVLFLAAFLSENREALAASSKRILGLQIPPFKMMLPLIGIWIISLIIVVFERDLGSALLFFGIFLVMLYTATGRLSYIIIGLVLLVFGAFGAYHFFGHVHRRFDIWLNPFQDPSNAGLQIVQSLYSLADGGIIGSGIGRGMPTKIPVVESDFIFSAIAEELGLMGGIAVILFFILFLIRGLLTASRAKSDLHAFTAVGLTTAISLQAFVIIGGVTKLIPLTGVTLPFMSQGGTSLLTSFIIVALLLKAGDEATGREQELIGDGINHAYQHLNVENKVVNFFTSGNYVAQERGVLGRVTLSERLSRICFAGCLLFAVLFSNLIYIQVIQAPHLKSLPSNNHTIARASYVERGAILTSDGIVLAQSIKNDKGSFERSYPQGTLASHLIGYSSVRFGSAGIESTQNETLTGHEDYSSWQGVLDSLAGKAQPGNDVVLTINSTVQRSAEKALRGCSGAIVVMDPRTGAILALASSPTYSKQQLADLITGKIPNNGALLNRATNALYAPGSTFKVVTLAAALESGVASLSSVYNAPATLDIGGARISNAHLSNYGDISLKEAFAKSANTVFGQVGAALGAQSLVNYARNFGFGSSIGSSINVKPSLMPKPSEMTLWETAWAACGQPVGHHKSPAGPQVTMLQEALIASTIAHNGIMMDPYLVQKVLSPAGTVVSQTTPRTVGKAVSAHVNDMVKSAMLDVVTSGTGRAARVKGVDVAGKTGTAQTGKENADSLFVGFAPYDKPTVAISVVIEEATDRTGAEVASHVLQAALLAQGSL